MMWDWPLYGLASAAILVSGFLLCREVDSLAARLGWTRGWAGLVVLATITSLPELFTGLSSVTIANTPRIAIGDVAGSLAFNLAILGVLAVAVRRPLFQATDPGHRHTALHALGLSAAVLALALAAGRVPHAVLAWAPWTLPVLYGLSMRRLHRLGVVTEAAPGAEARGSLGALLLHATILVAAASILPFAGAGIADSTGLGRTFVGGLIVAVSTSLPEVAVTMAAWRLGAPDLAVGNLLGSNLVDVAILGADDMVYAGALMSSSESGHVALFATATAMTALLWGALRWPSRASGRLVGVALVLLYVAAQALSFAAGRSH